MSFLSINTIGEVSSQEDGAAGQAYLSLPNREDRQRGTPIPASIGADTPCAKKDKNM
jgi:hypothetical protein